MKIDTTKPHVLTMIHKTDLNGSFFVVHVPNNRGRIRIKKDAKTTLLFSKDMSQIEHIYTDEFGEYYVSYFQISLDLLDEFLVHGNIYPEDKHRVDEYYASQIVPTPAQSLKDEHKIAGISLHRGLNLDMSFTLEWLFQAYNDATPSGKCLFNSILEKLDKHDYTIVYSKAWNRPFAQISL